MKIAIFDLDGVLFDSRHREPWIRGDCRGGPDWKAYYAAIPGDTVIEKTRSLIIGLYSEDYAIWFWTGRPESVREVTEEMIGREAQLAAVYAQLRMRGEDDFRTNGELKGSWAAALPGHQREQVAFVFDDNPKAVAAYQAAGLPAMLYVL